MRAQMIFDHFAAIANAEHYVAEPVAAQLGKLMVDERPAGNRHERLGDGLCNRSQACRQSSSQDHYRQGHVNTTLVPSKSKWKRTSSSPALAMAWRRRLRSEA